MKTINTHGITKLNLGCGPRDKDGYINLDIADLPGVDVVHNLEVIPYPFKKETFEYIEAEDVLEHVENFVGILDELWRILKVGGTLWVRGPHGAYPMQIWKDPTHRRAFVEESFDYWDPSTDYGKHYGYYGKAKFKITRKVEKNKGMEFTMVKMYV